MWGRDRSRRLRSDIKGGDPPIDVTGRPGGQMVTLEYSVLLALVLEFDSYLGEMLLAKINVKKKIH